MKHLRIKFVGKLDNLPLLHFKRLGSKASANFQVIEVAIFHSEDGVSHIHALKLRIEQRAKCAVIRLSIMNPRDCTDSSFPVADTPIRNYKETTECPQRTRLENKFWKQLWPGRMERIDCLLLLEQPTFKSWRVVIQIRSIRRGLSWWGQLLRMGSFIGRSLRLQWLPKAWPNGVPSDYTVQINSVEADWDDESERVEVRVELFLSSNRADVNINQLRYWVTILAQI